MSDTGLAVPGMTEPPRRYDITITADSDGGHLPDPAEFAVIAQQAESARGAAIVSAHTAGQIICVVTIHALDRVRSCRRCPGRGLRSAQTPGRASRPLIRQLAGLVPAGSPLIVRARAFRAWLDPLTPPLRNARRVTGCPVATSLRATTRA